MMPRRRFHSLISGIPVWSNLTNTLKKILRKCVAFQLIQNKSMNNTNILIIIVSIHPEITICTKNAQLCGYNWRHSSTRPETKNTDEFCESKQPNKIKYDLTDFKRIEKNEKELVRKKWSTKTIFFHLLLQYFSGINVFLLPLYWKKKLCAIEKKQSFRFIPDFMIFFQTKEKKISNMNEFIYFEILH